MLSRRPVENERRGWFGRRVGRWYNKDREKPGERAGNAFAIIVVTLVTLYFVSSQVEKTGFFAPSFGNLETFLFYLPVPLGIGVSLIRLVTGRKNPARPLDALNAAVIGVACFWFFVVFPFDFAHLGDLLPSQIQFLADWIPNYLARAVLLIGGFGSLFNAVYTPMIYLVVRSEYSRNATL
jgi:hypothetical protein